MAGLSRAEDSWLWEEVTRFGSWPASAWDPDVLGPLPCGDPSDRSCGIDASRAGDVEGEISGGEDAEEGEDEEEELDKVW